MKKILIFLVLTFCTMNAMADPSAKAIYCNSNKTLYFVYNENGYSNGGTFTPDGETTPLTITKYYTGFKDVGYTIESYYILKATGSGTERKYATNAPWGYYSQVITTVNFQNSFHDFTNNNYTNWFHSFISLTTLVNAANLNTSAAKDLSNLFCNCSNLTNGLDGLSSWDVSNVTTMANTFNGCSSITDLSPLSSWTFTDKLTSLASTFKGCSGITDLTGISGWNVSKVMKLSGTFSDCTSLTSLSPLSSWTITNNLTDLSNTFYRCYGITDLTGIGGWVVSNVTSLSNTFYDCSGLTSLAPLSSWTVTDKLTVLSSTFSGCSGITDLTPISGWEVSNVTTMASTFSGCSGLTSLSPLSNWTVTDKLTTLARTFRNCSGITDLTPISGWVVSNVATLSETFSGCSGITDLTPISGWEVSNVTTMASTFSGCSGLTSLSPLSNWTVTDKLTVLGSTFRNCSGITDLTGIGGWVVSNVTTMAGTFSGCSDLTSLAPLSSWTVTDKLTTLESTFHDCSGITDLTPISGWVVSNVTTLARTFWGCSGITDLTPISGWDVSNVTTLANTFYGCTGIILAPLSWNITDKLTTLESTFRNCSGISELPIGNWNVSNVTTMAHTFDNCSNLVSAPLSNWTTTDKLTTLESTFSGCNKLKNLDLSGLNTTNVTSMINMLSLCRDLTKVKFGNSFSTGKLKSGSGSSEGDYKMFNSTNRLRYVDYYDCYNESTGTPNSAVPSSSSFGGYNPKFSVMFNDSPETKVIYLPKGLTDYTNKQNVVYSNGGTLRCLRYFSEDQTIGKSFYNEIELPYSFQTNRAEYSRTMASGRKYGTIILPYDFTSNDAIQCYVLTQEHPKTMYFVEAETVPAHTPFLYEKLSSGTTASFVMEDATGNFGITVHATRDTSVPVPEEIPDGMTADDYGPYLGSYTITANQKVGAAAEAENLAWETRGYYETTVLDEDEHMFYVAQDKFFQAKNMTSADGNLTVYPHRATFHGNWNYELDEVSGARFFNISTPDIDDEETVTGLIEAGWEHQIENDAVTVYDMQGRQQPHLSKGMNIVRKSDGSIRKYIKK